MSDSFGTANFTVLYTGQTRTQQAQMAYLHVPGSSTNIIDNAGRMEEHLPLGIVIPSDLHYAALRGYVGALGTAGTLTYLEGTFTARLVNLQRRERTPEGYHYATAEFVVIS